RCATVVFRRPPQLRRLADVDSVPHRCGTRSITAARSRSVTGWLMDTDVLSAFAPGKPALAPEPEAWFRERADALFLSTISAMEIETGIAGLRRTGAAARAADLYAW